MLTSSVDDSTVAAHRLIMRVVLERQADDANLARLGAAVVALLSAVAPSLAEP